MIKLLTLGASTLLGLGLTGLFQGPPPPRPGDPPPPPKKKGEPKKGEPKKKGEPGPAGDLHRAYDLLRRLKADEGAPGRSGDKLRDWTDRAAGLYRKGVRAFKDDDPRLAHEYGAAAHDLARAADHARNATLFDRADAKDRDDLPPPPDGPGPGDDRDRVVEDLRRAHDRIVEVRDQARDVEDARFYLDAARDLYNAARRDVEEDRLQRAGELARAAEAMTHVPEHLAHAADRGPEGRDRRPPPPPPGDGPRARRDRRPPPPPDDGPPPKKGDRDRRPPPPDRDRGRDDLPPPL